MFEQTKSYEAAYVGRFPCFEEDARPALQWAAKMAAKHTCGITVVAPTRGRFRDTPLLAALPSSVEQATPQTLGPIPRTRPVVVAFWLTGRDLERLDSVRGIEALVVVPWQEEEITPWRKARRAVDLLGGQPVPEPPTIDDPVVREAMRSLTAGVNLSTGLGHPRDRSSAIEAFRILHRNEHRFESEEIQTWAMANGWDAEAARELGEYAAGVQAGKRYRTDARSWSPEIINIWCEQAAEA